MGQTLSTGKLTEPVTLPRIWSACQVKASMPPELQEFNIKLLVDDMNKLGANIPTDAPVEKTCKMIHEFLPNAEDVCFVGKNADPKAVYRAAGQFNKNFGTAIPVYKNGINDKDGYRAVHEVCDDMYMTQQRIYRSLNENTIHVKQKLYDSIVQLRAQQALLDKEFEKYKNLMTRGASLDGISKNLKEDLEMQKQILAQFNAQAGVLKDNYTSLHGTLKTLAPHMVGPVGVTPPGLIRVATVGGAEGGKRGVDEGQLTALLRGSADLAIVGQKLGDCFNLMNTAYDEYVRESAKPVESLKSWVASKQHAALLDDQVNNYGANTPLINECAVALVNSSGYTNNMMAVKKAAKGIVADSCTAENMYTNPALREVSCKQNNLCAWLNGTCVINDYANGKTGPQATKGRYINYDNYTVAAFESLRSFIEEKGKASNGVVTANQVEQYFIDKLFTEIFTRKARGYSAIAKFLETRSTDGEGIMVNKYLSSFYGNMLASFATYLIRTYSLNVKNIASQNTLLKQAYEAYYDANSSDPRVKGLTVNASRILDKASLEKLFADYENSREAHMLFDLHNNHLSRYV
jgi:hypothetical protein